MLRCWLLGASFAEGHAVVWSEGLVGLLFEIWIVDASITHARRSSWFAGNVSGSVYVQYEQMTIAPDCGVVVGLCS